MWLCLFLSSVLAVSCVADGDHILMTSRCTSDNTTCYSLYRADRDVITWGQAYDYCQQIHQRLALIVDSTIQAIIRQLNSKITHFGDGHAWVAGRRSVDTTWYDVSGSIYAGKIYETYKSSQTKCVQLYNHNATRRYSRLEAQPCYAVSLSSVSRALCQYVMTPYVTSCEGFNLSGVCYVSSAAYMRTWYDARRLCMTSYPEGDLAYSRLWSDSLRDFFWTESRIISGFSQNLWVGIERNRWKWIRDNVELPVTYSAWYPEEGAGLNEDCLLVDLNANSSWADKSCNYTSSYFICQHETTTESHGGHSTTKRSTTSVTVTTETSSYISTESTDRELYRDWSTIIIVSTVVGLLFMVMLIGLVICVLRDRRKFSKSLLRRFLAYGHFGGNGNRVQPTEQETRDSSDWTKIVMADRLDERSLDGVRISDASSVSVGMDLSSVSGFPPEGQPVEGTAATSGEMSTTRREVKPSPGTLANEGMASRGQRSEQEETYLRMSTLGARKYGLGKDDLRKIAGYQDRCLRNAEDAEGRGEATTSKPSGRQPLNPGSLAKDDKSVGVADVVEDSMYVVRITLPQQEIAAHANHDDRVMARNGRYPTSGSEPHYKSPRLRPKPIYATVSKRPRPVEEADGREIHNNNTAMASNVDSGYNRNTTGSGDDLDIIKEVELALRKIDQIE